MRTPDLVFCYLKAISPDDHFVATNCFVQQLCKLQLGIVTRKLKFGGFYMIDIVTYNTPKYLEEIRNIARRCYSDGCTLTPLYNIKYNPKYKI